VLQALLLARYGTRLARRIKQATDDLALQPEELHIDLVDVDAESTVPILELLG